MTNPGEGLDTVIGGAVKAVDPQAATARASEGRSCEQAGDRVGAIAAYREAVELGEGPDVMFRLGWLLDQHGEEDEAGRLPSVKCVMMRFLLVTYNLL